MSHYEKNGRVFVNDEDIEYVRCDIVAELVRACKAAEKHISGEAEKFSEREPIAVLYQLRQALTQIEGETIASS